jgi:hypothetical protein
MFDEYLQPYLYKSVRNLNHSSQFDFLNELNQLNVSVNPELNNIYQEFGSFMSQVWSYRINMSHYFYRHFQTILLTP